MSDAVQAPAERRQAILDRLRRIGSVRVAELEQEFAVSGMTLRRDLRALERGGQALRTHGGAVLPSHAAVEGSFAQRLDEDVESKLQLARAVVGLVHDDETVFVDSSTASYYAARELVQAGRRLTLITNSLPVLELAADAPAIELIDLGGAFQPLARCFAGPATARAVRALVADKSIVCVRGLTVDGGLSDINPLEAEVKHLMIECARESLLLVTAQTLSGRGVHVHASLRDVTHVVATGICRSELQWLKTHAGNVRLVCDSAA
jgi:DeoR/GlpR family transcriptional regulator of sugar metabolism